MNTIIQSPLATDPNKQQAWTIPDMLFNNAGIKEAFLNTILTLIGNSYSSSIPYIMQGCVRTGTADAGTGSVAITAGSIFYNGEIYTVPAFSGSLSANYVVGTLTTTYGMAEVLKDGTSTNVQQIKKIIWSVGASGSSTFDQSACVSAQRSVRMNDVVTTGGVGNIDTVVHSFIPSVTNSYTSIIAFYSGVWNDASASPVSWKLYIGGTVSGYTPGSVGGTISGGTLATTSTDNLLSSSVNLTNSFMHMFAYTAGQRVTLTANATTGTAVIATQSELIVDSGR